MRAVLVAGGTNVLSDLARRDPLTEEEIQKARQAVAEKAKNVGEAGTMLRMLGIHPSQEEFLG